MEHLTRIKQLISERAGVEPGEVSLDSYIEDDLNIAPMELVEILSELEEEYDIELLSEKENMIQVSDIYDLVTESLE